MSVLYVVATPIGNLEDLSPRARRVLAEVTLIAAEDTRHTGMLLKRLGISTPMLSNHDFNEHARLSALLGALASGDVALVSDAGTPAISDPGTILVRAAADAGHQIMPVPGPCAMTAAVSASGLIEGPFTFLGFLPRTTGERRSVTISALAQRIPLVIYESGNRIDALAELLADLAPEREMVIFRELTKVHEEAIRDTCANMPAKIATMVRKGEFVIVIGPATGEVTVDLDAIIRERLTGNERPSELARAIARETGRARSDVYARILELAREGQGA